jgi:hypothetical protein
VNPADPLDTPDPVVEAYKRDVDRTLLDRNLQLSSSERVEQLQRFVAFLAEVRAAGSHQPDPPRGRSID